MYSQTGSDIYVNLFIGSTTVLENISGTDVEIVQTTDYPWSGRINIGVNPTAEKRFSVRVRIPNRSVSDLYSATPDADGLASISINGAALKPSMEKGYAVISRVWKAGDRIDVVLPMKPQRIRAIDKVAATRNKVALRYGPLIYNIERADQDIAGSLPPGAPLTTEWRPDFLGGVMVMTSRFADGTPLLAIPNFVRMNREPGTPLPPPRPPRGSTPPNPSSIVWIREGS
jgi:DUF1680 family protein